MSGNWALVDVDTPLEARTKKDYKDGKDWQLIFSDEFNRDGRTFYPGDDPYWEAVDLQYWQTNNLEWYDPAAITTKDGSLEITLTKQNVHELEYQGGMMSTWNKFCFTGGVVEASLVLPGANNIAGLWPAFWLMGNLGRAGFGASLEGMVSLISPLSWLVADEYTVAVYVRLLRHRDSREPDYQRPPRRRYYRRGRCTERHPVIPDRPTLVALHVPRRVASRAYTWRWNLRRQGRTGNRYFRSSGKYSNNYVALHLIVTASRLSTVSDMCRSPVNGR